MRYIWQHIRVILERYDGTLPLTHYLKSYCRQYPALGSRDRRLLSDMAYSWYRCSRGLLSAQKYEFEIMMKVCLTFCGAETAIRYLFPAENALPSDIEFDIHRVFNQSIDISPGFNGIDWLNSMLVQPALFIRIRKNKDVLTVLLEQAGITFEQVNDTCLALPNGARIDALLPADSYVVQDASSQAACSYFTPKKNETWLDCCSGAGGKSLLLKDMEPGIKQVATDIRQSILHNLKERFKLYGLTPPAMHVADAADAASLEERLGNTRFDHIICDVPCSGSGTWARTPEQLYFFDEAKQRRYPILQRSIATNAVRYLKPGGTLYYITCSVFAEENEAIITHLIQTTGLQPEQQQLINGIPLKADSMFVSVLRKV